MRTPDMALIRRTNDKRPSGPFVNYAADELRPWFAVTVNRDRSARGRQHLHAVVHSPEVVGYVPIGRPCTCYFGAALHILTVTATAHARAVRGTSHCTASGGDVLTAPAANLMTQYATNDCTQNRSRRSGFR